MRSSFPRLLAATFLAISGVVTGLTAIGLTAADAVISTGRFAVLPADVRALDQLASVTPFVAVFALASLAAAVALVLEASWSRRLAIGVTAIGVGFGIVTLAAVLLAQGPFAVMPSERVLDGIEAIGAFTAAQVIALIASIVDRSPRRVTTVPAPAG